MRIGIYILAVLMALMFATTAVQTAYATETGAISVEETTTEESTSINDTQTNTEAYQNAVILLLVAILIAQCTIIGGFVAYAFLERFK